KSPGGDANPSPAPAVIPSHPKPFLHSPFIGPNGLRAGWRFAIYLAVFFALLFVMSFATRPFLHLKPHQIPPLWVLLLGEFQSLIAAVVPAFVLARYEKRPFGSYGLPRPGSFGKQFWIGLIWGICAITVLMLMLRGAGGFYFGGLALHGIRVA